LSTISSKSFTVDNQEVRMSKGQLIRVQVGPGRFVKMYEADAIAAGYMAAPQAKAQPPAQNKMRLPAENKAPELEPEEVPEPDDFTVIDGVGPATARALAANGITTFAQLRTAGELGYLTATVNAAIEEWRKHG
jgi:predicted flap endonuclease-1-like 5' DNA nuclease